MRLIFSIGMIFVITSHLAANPLQHSNVYQELRSEGTLLPQVAYALTPFQNTASVANYSYRLGTQTRNLGIAATALGVLMTITGSTILSFVTNYPDPATEYDIVLQDAGYSLIGVGTATAITGIVAWIYGSSQRQAGLASLHYLDDL